MTPKQMAANRANAQKSTGPKTPEGRAASRMNALKHGILSKEVLVRGSNLKESGRELAALQQRFWEELDPVGPVEEMLVDRIVTTHWRLRRALTAESGEIALSVDGGKKWRSQPLARQMKCALWTLNADPLQSMGESALGNGILEMLLQKVRTAVEQQGELTEAAIKILAVGDKPNDLTERLEVIRLKGQANPEGLEPAGGREKSKAETLKYLDQQLSFVEWQKSDCERREATEEEAQQAAAVLPSAAVLDKILRYETMLERQLHRAMAQLERLQRMRRGEAVAAPVSVAVS